MSNIFIECGDVTINSERILYAKKSVDEGSYIVFFDNEQSITVSGEDAKRLLFKLSYARRSESSGAGLSFCTDGLILRRKQDAREANMIPCSRCGRGALPRGVTYHGPVVCQSCMRKQQRIRMA